jgi:hypothetical protein
LPIEIALQCPAFVESPRLLRYLLGERPRLLRYLLVVAPRLRLLPVRVVTVKATDI